MSNQSPMAKVSEGVDSFMSAWSEFKSANDERIRELETRGASDPLHDAKLSAINAHLNRFEQRPAPSVRAVQAVETKMARLVRRAGQKPVDPDDWLRGLARRAAGQKSSAMEQKAWTTAELQAKALQEAVSIQGGYLAPIELSGEILKRQTEISPVRSLARGRQTGMRELQQPKRTSAPVAAWTALEGASKTPDTNIAWGRQAITPHEMFVVISVANDSLEDPIYDLAIEIQEDAAEAFALLEGNSFVNGLGVGESEGFLVNSEVPETNSGSAASIADSSDTADGLLKMKYALKDQYRRNGMWLMTRGTLGLMRRLKDGDGNYIWSPHLNSNNTIDGDPYTELPDMPQVAANAFPVAYGDLRRAYTIADRIQMEILRDPYTQATSGETRFVCRRRVGGKIVMAEAIGKLKCSV